MSSSATSLSPEVSRFIEAAGSTNWDLVHLLTQVAGSGDHSRWSPEQVRERWVQALQ